MMKRISIAYILILFVFCSCNQSAKNEVKNSDMQASGKQLNESAMQVRDFVKKDIVIAHRGTMYWAPEETEPAFVWARNLGADYLEFDVQLTKDSVLVAFHDSKLKRTSNVAEIFPERADGGINDFTLKELRKLDVGSWFNEANPDLGSMSFRELRVLTLEDVLMIAEGYRLKKLDGDLLKEMNDGLWTGHYVYEIDTEDKGHRPGVYIETKSPKPGTERILASELERLGWNINHQPKGIQVEKDKIAIANTQARVILQSFSRKSIEKLEMHLPNIPKCLLLWKPKMKGEIKAELQDAIDFAVENNVHIMGPSIAGEPNNYGELAADWMTDMMHEAGMIIHPYTFDTDEQFAAYIDRVEGLFTNRADLALLAYGRSVETVSFDKK